MIYKHQWIFREQWMHHMPFYYLTVYHSWLTFPNIIPASETILMSENQNVIKICNYVFVLLCFHLWSNRNHNAHGLPTQWVTTTEITAVNVNGFLSLIQNWKHNLHNTHFSLYLHQITAVTWVSVMKMRTQTLTLVHYILCIVCWLSLIWTMKA